jgi:hypothetical protein
MNIKNSYLIYAVTCINIISNLSRLPQSDNDHGDNTGMNHNLIVFKKLLYSLLKYYMLRVVKEFVMYFSNLCLHPPAAVKLDESMNLFL